MTRSLQVWESKHTVLCRSTHRWPRPAYRQDFRLQRVTLRRIPNLGIRPKQKLNHRLRFANQGVGQAQFLENIAEKEWEKGATVQLHESSVVSIKASFCPDEPGVTLHRGQPLLKQLREGRSGSLSLTIGHASWDLEKPRWKWRWGQPIAPFH